MINQKDLLAAYDREHVGPPGRARELIAAAPITHPILLDTPEIAAREVVWLQDKDKEQPSRLAQQDSLLPSPLADHSKDWVSSPNPAPSLASSVTLV